MAEPWVSIDDVAAHLGVRKESVYRWIEQRGLPATKIGKLWKLKLSEVDAWMLASRSVSAPRSIKPSSKVVMVIDDDELVRDTLTDFLGDEGFGVLLAADGAVAFDVLAAASPLPSLIILDLKMPNLDGWQFLEEQARAPHLASIPVIVVTAVPSDGVTAAAVLPKPLRLNQLAHSIESILGPRAESIAVAATPRTVELRAAQGHAHASARK